MSPARISPRTWLGILLSVLSAVPAPGESDWRLELLNQRGFSGETHELEALMKQHAAAAEGLHDTLAKLASDDFKTRERAVAAILMAGDAALPWIDGLPGQEDPEVRFRLGAITTQLRNRSAGSQVELLDYAVRSLLRERKDGGEPDSPELVFAEWFERKAGLLGKRYGHFEFHADAGMQAKVTAGRLHFPGDHNGDGDQVLVLTAAALGLEKFPGQFRVSCLLGGEGRKGAGAWHAGVSVGQVRLLYHPGMQGGAFRAETTGEKKIVSDNESMGFDPETTSLQRMEVTVRQEKSGDVKLEAMVASFNGKHVFRKKIVVPRNVIGAVDQVGLWRSGRKGADALFDDFVLDLRE